MRKFTLAVLACLLMFSMQAADLSSQKKDVVRLNNTMAFQGKVVKIKSCALVFKTEAGKFRIPITDIDDVEFTEKSKKYESKFEAYQNDPRACDKGVEDARNFHGKSGLHVLYGALFGPFAVIGAAVAAPTPLNGKMTPLMSQNKELFNDPLYLTCYKKKARGKNIVNTAIGWGAIMALLLIAGG